MKISSAQFSDLIALLHSEGVTIAVSEYPEVAHAAAALAELEKAQQGLETLEEQVKAVAAHVDQLEAALHLELVEAA